MTISAVLIAGPTASGKSDLAVHVAKQHGGVVINADSMQVYADLHVLTARPDAAQMQGVPHHLFGHVDGAVNYSVGHYLDDLSRLLAECAGQGVLPVIVGGTGMYFRALTQGISAIPSVPAEVRAAVRREAEGLPPESLHAELMRLDPDMATRLRPSDPQRLLRALEVLRATGRSLSFWQEQKQPPLLPVDTTRAIFIDPPRPLLMDRINRRFETMIEQGAMDEVARLRDRQLDPALPVMRAHGVPGLIAALDGVATIEAAITRGQMDTRHYAKRQVTWFRHQLAGFEALPLEDAYRRGI